MSLLVSAIHSETPSLIEEGVRLEAIGNLSRLPEAAKQALRESIQATAACERITLIVALSYSSRDEILRATTQIAREVAEGRLSADSLTEETISAHLDTAAFPDPDLLIRTGGEERISNYLLWQAAYAELFFSSVYWPDFGREALREALEAYTARERRFGKTSEQIQLED